MRWDKDLNKNDGTMSPMVLDLKHAAIPTGSPEESPPSTSIKALASDSQASIPESPKGGADDDDDTSSGIEHTPTSLPKPSPPSPEEADPPVTPAKNENLEWAVNVYSKRFGIVSPPAGIRSPDTDDTIPLDSPWETPGIRRKDRVLSSEQLEQLAVPDKLMGGSVESLELELPGDVSPLSHDTVSIFGSDFADPAEITEKTHSEGGESGSWEDPDEALVT